MKKNIEAISQKLDSLESEANKIGANSRKERADLTDKLKTLEAKQKEPSSLEEYKAVSQEIRDTRAYLDYLNTTEENAKKGFLSDAEMKEIRESIKAEVDEIQKNTAPDMQKKLFEIIELMDRYTAEVIGYETLLNRASRLHSPRFVAGVSHLCSDIAETNPDKVGYWAQFVYMYYSLYDTAQNIKRNENGNPWKKAK